jgi:hypothetical protein
MSSAADQSNFPTMIIPKGTEIKINPQGQLSIRTAGNLVIQNSGNYSELESTSGSIRIEDNVNVEAISVRAAQSCYIQGTLTAWRVKAKRIALEDRAKAYIMLQESEQLELSKTSRLVGNFTNEKEIYLMLGKFTQQLKQLPGSVDMHDPDGGREPQAIAARPEGGETPAPLRQAISLIEDELGRPDLDSKSGQALREIVHSIRERNYTVTAVIYRDAFGELNVSSEGLTRAYELIESHFRSQRV